MDAAICREYGSSLSDLKINSKPHINMLTMLAEENVEHASHIVRLIEARLQKAPATEKLPVMYLMDSIVKNVKKGPYQQLFAKNLTNNFCGVFAKVDEKTRASLFKLRSTWNQYFASGILHGLDVRVQKIDPAWPIMASAAAPSASIHINPKFIKKPAPMESTTTTTTTSVPPTTDSASSAQLTEKERLEQEMRQSLISKQQELLQIQQQRLELELQQTKAKLEAQTKELAVKNEAIAQQQLQLSQMSAQKTPATSSEAPPILPSVAPPVGPPPSVALPPGAIPPGTLPPGAIPPGTLPPGPLPTSIADPTSNLALAALLLKQGGIQGMVPAGPGILGAMPTQHQQPAPGPQTGLLGVSPHIRPSAPPPVLIPASGGPPTGIPSVMQPVPSDSVSSMPEVSNAAASDTQMSHVSMPTPQSRDPRRAAAASRDPRLARDPRLRQAMEQQQQQKQQQEQLMILQQRKQQMKQQEQQQQEQQQAFSDPAAPFSSPQAFGAEPQVTSVVTPGNTTAELTTSSARDSTTTAAPTQGVQSSASVTPLPVKSTASSKSSDKQKPSGAEPKKPSGPSGVQKSSDSGAPKKKSPIKGKAPAPKSSKTAVKLEHLDLSSKEKLKEESLHEKETKETKKQSTKKDKVVEKASERDTTKRGLRSSTRNYRKTLHNEKEEKGRSDSRTSKRLPSSESASGSESQPRSRSRSPHSGSRSPRSSERGDRERSDRERRSGKSTTKEDSRRKDSKENKPEIKTEKRKSPSPERLDEDKSLLKKYSKPDQLPPKKRARLIEREQQKAERDRENQIQRDRSARERAAGWERSSSREYEGHHGQYPYGQRPPHRRPSLVDPNVTIPQELSLNKLAEVLKQADKQLHSGALSHDQHQQLLRELNEIYKIHHRKREEEQHRHQHPPHYPRRALPAQDPRITRAPQDPRGPRDPRDPRAFREMHSHPDIQDHRGPPDMRNFNQRDPRDSMDSRDFHDMREHPDTDAYRKDEYPKRRTLLEDPRMRSFPSERRIQGDSGMDVRKLGDVDKGDSLSQGDFRSTSEEVGQDVDERKTGVFKPYNGPIKHGHPFAPSDTDERDVHLFTMRSDHGDLDMRKLPPGRNFDTDDRLLPSVFHADSKKEAILSDTDERKSLQSGDSNSSRALDDSTTVSEKLSKSTTEASTKMDTVKNESSDVGIPSESLRKDVKDERRSNENEANAGDTFKASKQTDSKLEQDVDMRQISECKKESKSETVGSNSATFTEELKQMPDLNQVKEKSTAFSELKEQTSDKDERPKAGEIPAENEEPKRDTDDRKLLTGLNESSNPDVELPAGDVDLRHPVEGQERFDKSERQNMEQRAAPPESQDIPQLSGPFQPHLQEDIPAREQIPRNGPVCGHRPLLRQFSGGMSNRWQQWKKDHPEEVCAPHNEGEGEGMDPRDPRYARRRRDHRVSSREGERHLLEHPPGRPENIPPFEHRDLPWKDEHFSGPLYRQHDDIPIQPRDQSRNEPRKTRGHPPMHMRLKQRGDPLLETPHNPDEGQMMDRRDDFPPHADSENLKFEEFQRRDRWSSRRGNRPEFLPERGPRNRHPDAPHSPSMENQEREQEGPPEMRDEPMYLRGNRLHEDLDVEQHGPPGFSNREGGPQFHRPDGPPFQPGDRPDYRGPIDPESQRRERLRERRHMRPDGQDEQRHRGPGGPDNHGRIGPEGPDDPRFMGPARPDNHRHIHREGPDGPRFMGPGGPDSPPFMGPVGSEGPRHLGPGGQDGPRFMGPEPPRHMGPEPPRHMGPGGPDFPRFMGPGGPDSSRFMGPGRPDGPRHMGPGGPSGPRQMGPRHGGPGGPDGPRLMVPGGPDGPRHMGPGGPDGPRHMGPHGPDGPRHVGPGGPDGPRHQGFQGPDGIIRGMPSQPVPTSINPPTSSAQGPTNGSGGGMPPQIVPNLGNLQQIVQNVSQQVVKQMQQQMLSSNPQLMTHLNSPNLLQAALHNLGVRGNVPSNILQAAQQSLLQKIQSMPGINMMNRLRPGAPNFPNQGGIERQPHPQGPVQPQQEMFDQQGGPSGMPPRPPFPPGIISSDPTQQGGVPPDMPQGLPPGVPPGVPPGIRPPGVIPNSMPPGNMGPPLQPEVLPPQGMPPHSMPQGAVAPPGPPDMQRPNLGMMPPPPMGMIPGPQGPRGPNLAMMPGGPGIPPPVMMAAPHGVPQGPPGMHPGGPMGMRPGGPQPIMNAAPTMEQGFHPPQEGTQPLAPPASVTSQVDINSLFSKLIATGIIKGPTKSDSPHPEETGTPPPTSVQPSKEGIDKEKESHDKEDAEEIPDAEDQGSYDIPEINLTLEDLKPRYPGVVKRMYSGMQCTSCGQRFVIAQMDRYRKHLDWHFRQNRKKQDGNKATTSRKWFYEVDEWLDYEEINDMEDARSTFFDEQAQELAERGQGAASVPITSDPTDEYCKICREQFEQFFDEETEEWHLRDAVRVEGRTFHPSCYDDVKDTSGFLETPTDDLHSPPFVRTRNISFSGVPISPGASFSSQQPLFPGPLGAATDTLPFPTIAGGASTITEADAGATPMETEQAGKIEGTQSTEGGLAADTDVKVKVKVEPEEPMEVGPDVQGASMKEMSQVKSEPEETQEAHMQVPPIKAEVPEVKSETTAVTAEQGASSVEGNVKDEPGAAPSTQTSHGEVPADNLVKTETPSSVSDFASMAQPIEVIGAGKSFPQPDSKKLPPPLAEAVASLRESKEACQPPVLEAEVPLASSSPGRGTDSGQSTSTGIFEKLTPPPALSNMEGSGSETAKDPMKETSPTQPPEVPMTKETPEPGNGDPAAEGAAKGVPSPSSTSEGTNPPPGSSAGDA